jgi:hypothetical protein
MTTSWTKPSPHRRVLLVALRRMLLPLAVGGALACHDFVDPPLPAGAEAFEAPAEYELWWQLTQACANRTAPMSRVSWYVVRGARMINDGGKMVSAYWSAGSNRIVLTEEAAKSGPVVRHEMLHSLLQGGGHSRTAFLDDCGGVVSCGEDCLHDAGPAPPAPASAVVVPAESLVVTVTVSPAIPGNALFGGHFVLTVLARNPGQHFVVATLPDGDAGGAVAFQFEAFRPEVASTYYELYYDDPVRDVSVARFAPGETKRHVFDIAIGAAGQPWSLWPGTHRVNGGYGGQWSPSMTLEISP